ncbi:xanthine dehydrogenase family protein subunit M [Pseudonocardia sp. C8]|uniref:FAD binding domain-containing protein n=1 Tax=Pseudonocardia sp. C8 TaxID=2762759 RepID=UPI0016435240|nr:xanthine dehydrogenase family protein subunit M [Pseudonocardia sp. C8]MBC3191785.1 xanthine dehydrogenase family protein subunit M [Pseudonocardia sp. C8]
MKPPPFEYCAPRTLTEAVGLLGEVEDAKVIAGGQSLIPLMNMRLARPARLVDACRVPELGAIRRNGHLSIGATARQTAVLRSAEVREFAPIIPEALSHVGHAANRNRGTFGGSVAHADPAAELPTVLRALGADIVVQGPAGERVIPADDFFVSYFTTALSEDEILTEIRLPRRHDPTRGVWAFTEVARRHGDFALVGVALVAELDDDRRVTAARICLNGVAERPHRAEAAEQYLHGRRLDDPDVAREAGRLAAADLQPPSDLHASDRYRKDAAAALVARAVGSADARSAGAAPGAARQEDGQ